MVFLEFSGNQWFPLELRWRCSLNTLVFRIKSRHLSRFQGHMGFSLSHSRAVGMPLELKRETRGPFPVASWILEFLSIIKRSQASSPLKHATPHSSGHIKGGVKPPVPRRWGTRVLSRVSTGNSDIPSRWERKHRLACESLHGNLVLPRVRGTRCPFHLRQQI